MATEGAKDATAPPTSQAEQAAPSTTTATTNPLQEQAAAIIEDQAETAPDPDEDDLSDLDDVLDEFSAASISKPTPPTASGPGRPGASATQPSAPIVPPTSSGAGPGGLFADEDEFSKAMQAGMAELMGEFESNPDMQKQFEDLVKELGEGMGAVAGETGIVPEIPQVDSFEIPAAAAASSTTTVKAPVATESSKAAAEKKEASFEDTIRATMERMNASNSAATASASAAASAPDEDFLAQMLKEMEKGGGAGGLGSDEDFSKMLMGMMEQLTNKEILYEPMKELHDKFPDWMKENESKTPKEDLDRYKEQKRLVGEIVGKFEETGYSDSKVEYREYIVERMQAMQAAGSPPPDLVGDMNAAQEALGDLDGGCPQQ